MPAKKTQITDAERAANMQALAREVGASNDPAALDAALRKIAERQPELEKAASAKKTRGL
jgi:hypothetical protein